MEELTSLGFGISGIAILSILYIYIKRLKKKFRKYILRFEKIKDRF
jgi:hypothetical protein